MIYVGSKRRLSKELAPIIQSYITKDTTGYLEPFVGGANMIDKISHKNRVGCDIDEYVISTLIALRDGWIPPKTVTKEEYLEIKNNKDNYEKHLVGYIGYQLSFGAKWFGGYVKRDDSKSRGDLYSYNHCVKQSHLLKDISFYTKSFLDLNVEDIKNYVIYCDIPYKGTLEYKNKKFEYEAFYQWCVEMARFNVVLVSEYNMPEDFFECIWSKESKVLLDSNKTSNNKDNIRIEKLFKVKHQ